MPAVKKTSLLAVLLVAALGGVLALVLRDRPGAGPGELVPGRAEALPGPAAGGEAALARPGSEEPAMAAPAPGDAGRTVLGSEPAAEDVAERPRAGGAAPSGPFLFGSVVDVNGAPIAGAEVSLDAAEQSGGVFLAVGGKAKPLSETATTDRGGIYRVARGRHGDAEVTIEVQARGYLPRTEVRFPDAAEGDASLGTSVLERGVVLAGTVTDASGAPVAGATVLRTTRDQEGMIDGILGLAASMNGAGSERVETDAEGRFELAHEAAGDYVMIFEHAEYPRGRLEGQTPPAGQSATGLELRFAPAAAITGRVLGYPPGREHVIVQARIQEPTEEQEAAMVVTFFDEISGGSGPTAEVGPDGTFTLPGLTLGASYRIQAFAKSGMFERIPASDAREAEAGASGVELVWDAGGRVAFDVVDAETGRPIEGEVEVRHVWQEGGSRMMPSSVKKHSFEGRRVEVGELRPDPSPGLLDLVVSAEGYLDHRESGVVVEADGEVELAVVRLRRAPTLRVQVLDAASGEPIRRARVALYPEVDPVAFAQDEDVPYEQALVSRATSEKTEKDGWCELPVCAADAARLVVKKSGYVDHEVAGFAVPREGGHAETVRLQAGGEVEITVVDGEGRPVEGARVFQRGDADDEGAGTRETNSRGVALFKDLGPGEHEFRAARHGRGNVRVEVNGDEDGHAPAEDRRWASVSVASGDRSRLRLGIPSNATVIGQVTSGGVPVAGVPVVFLEGSEASEADALLTRVSDSMAAMMGGSSARTRTDDEGRFRLVDVPAGEHRLHVAPSPGAPPHVTPTEVVEGENRVDIELPGGAVEGRVVDRRGEPIAGARVRIGQASAQDVSGEIEVALSLFGADPGGVLTDYDGSFAVPGLPSGAPLQAGVEASGFVPGASDEFTVPEGGRQRGVEVVLQRGGSVEVQVGEEQGPFVMVRATWAGDPEITTLPRHVFARRGKALIDGLDPGPWRISTSRDDDEGGEPAGEVVDVRPGERLHVTL